MTPESGRLAAYMSSLSEAAYAAAWMQHLEFALWHAVVTGPFQYGRLLITQTHIDELRRLSDASKGWVYFDDQNGETWIPLNEWQDVYSQNIELVSIT